MLSDLKIFLKNDFRNVDIMINDEKSYGCFFRLPVVIFNLIQKIMIDHCREARNAIRTTPQGPPQEF